MYTEVVCMSIRLKFLLFLSLRALAKQSPRCAVQNKSASLLVAMVHGIASSLSLLAMTRSVHPSQKSKISEWMGIVIRGLPW